MSKDEPAEVCVLLTQRQQGGHEVALFGWLADAVREHGLRPQIVAATPELAAACSYAGLSSAVKPLRWRVGARLAMLRELWRWPAERPLLLSPGVLHMDTWLLAAAVLLRYQLWVYVPMGYSARHMGFRAFRFRDALIKPFLGNVRTWITIDRRQAAWLTSYWGVTAPVHQLPNRARVASAALPWPAQVSDGRLRVAFVGRLDPWQKGLDWLVGLLLSKPAWGEGLYWRFQGRGAGLDLLQAAASALGPERAQIHPYAPLDEALVVSDVLLLCSRFEGLPLVALEAITRGWPVIATRACGLNALLPAASLFDFGDETGLARALDSLRTPEARRAAVAHASARLTAENGEARYALALREVVSALRRSKVGPRGPRRTSEAQC